MTEAHSAMLRQLEAEQGVTLSLGYIGNCSAGGYDPSRPEGYPFNYDHRSWSVDITSMPVPRENTEGRGPWSHRASGTSYPATRSWRTHEFPTVNELRSMILVRLVREKDAQDAAHRRVMPAGLNAQAPNHLFSGLSSRLLDL